MVGKSLTNLLKSHGYKNLLVPSSKELDLTAQNETENYFRFWKPKYVFFLAAKVGGILENIKHPADFGYINGMMALNVIETSRKFKIKKLLYVGSSCIYPKECPQPMKEESLLTGPLEPTNEMYSLSKIFGLKLCESYNKQYGTNFISCTPPNLFGINDHFDETSHMMAALIQRFHNAKINNLPSVSCYGTGVAKREFMYVDDVSDAMFFLMNTYNSSEHINIGTGIDYSIKEYAEKIKNIVGYTGEILWDSTKPDGMLRKVVDTTKINNLGWVPKISVDEGIKLTYEWFKEHISTI